MCKYTLFLAFIYILKLIQMYNMMPVTQDIFEKKTNKTVIMSLASYLESHPKSKISIQ